MSLPLVGKDLSPRPSPDAPAIASARAEIPKPKPWPAHFSQTGEAITLKIENTGGALKNGGKISFLPLDWGRINHAAPQKVSLEKDSAVIGLQQGDLGASKAKEPLDGVLAIETAGAGGKPERHGFVISAAPSDTPIAPTGTAI